MVLSGSAELRASSAPGLSFRQFMDALARCGLLGFSSKYIDGTSTPAFGGGIGVTRNLSGHLSTAERVQAMLITKMRLLDNQHIDARLQQLVRSPPTNHEGETPEEGTTLEGTKQRDTRGRAAGAGAGHGGKKKGGRTARGSNNARGPRGGGRKAAGADPKPATILAPIQTTPRGRENVVG